MYWFGYRRKLGCTMSDITGAIVVLSVLLCDDIVLSFSLSFFTSRLSTSGYMELGIRLNAPD